MKRILQLASLAAIAAAANGTDAAPLSAEDRLGIMNLIALRDADRLG